MMQLIGTYLLLQIILFSGFLNIPSYIVIGYYGHHVGKDEGGMMNAELYWSGQFAEGKSCLCVCKEC